MDCERPNNRVHTSRLICPVQNAASVVVVEYAGLLAFTEEAGMVAALHELILLAQTLGGLAEHDTEDRVVRAAVYAAIAVAPDDARVVSNMKHRLLDLIVELCEMGTKTEVAGKVSQEEALRVVCRAY